MTELVVTAVGWILFIAGIVYFPLSIAAVVGIALLER